MKKLNKKGFTIVELVIVIAVIAILAAVLIPTFSDVVAKANKVAIDETLSGAYTMYTIDVADSGFAYAAKDAVVFEYDGEFYKLIGDEYKDGQSTSGYTCYKNVADPKNTYIVDAGATENYVEISETKYVLTTDKRYQSGTTYYNLNAGKTAIETTIDAAALATAAYKYSYNDVVIYVLAA